MTSRDRPARRRATGAFRPRRTGPATLAALLLAVVAVVTAIEAIAAATGRRAYVPSVLRAAGQVRWDDPAALLTAAVACALGIVLLGLAFIPGHTHVIPLSSPDPQSVVGVSRSGLRRHLATVAAGIDGVSSARVRLRRHRVRVRAVTPLREAGELSGQISEALTGRLEELAPLTPLRVQVSVRQREE